MKYKKRALKIDAIQYNGKNEEEIKDFTNGVATYKKKVVIEIDGKKFGLNEGDWLIQDDEAEYGYIGIKKFEESFEPDN